ncbi:MAG: hypothetical protein NXY57DRAFT_968546 [Lentinula lateritia]|nr:MAG: hypothetical protein NXY57DRAFT_968546 [Lentinula lateritia]
MKGQITHSAGLLAKVDQNQPQILEFLVTNIGSENIILGLPWLRKVNPDINWRDGQIQIPAKPKVQHCVAIEEVPEPKEPNVGGNTEQILEPNRPESSSLPHPAPRTELSLETTETGTSSGDKLVFEESGSPLYRLTGNRKQRRAWLRAGFIQEVTEELWCAAGYTYLQQLAKAANKDKPRKTFEEMVPEPYRRHAKVFSEKESE